MAVPAAALPEHRKDVTLFRLFSIFATISATGFGSAGIPMMRQEFVVKRKWLTEREYLDIYAIAQVSPGAIPVSLAVLIGRKLAGPRGFWLCLAAETVPGFIVLMTIALLSMNPHMAILRAALKGCAAAAAGMLAGNALEMSWPYRTRWHDVAIGIGVGIAVLTFHASLVTMFVIFIPLSMLLQRATQSQ